MTTVYGTDTNRGTRVTAGRFTRDGKKARGTFTYTVEKKGTEKCTVGPVSWTARKRSVR